MPAEDFVDRPAADRFEPAVSAGFFATDFLPTDFFAAVAGFAAALRPAVDLVDDPAGDALDAAWRAALRLAGALVAVDFEVVPAPRFAVDFFFAAAICFTSRRM